MALRDLFKKLRSPARAICHFPKPPQRHEVCGFSIYYKGALVREYYGKALLKEVALFDIYRGKGVAEGKKSVAFSLVLRADDRTLTDADSEGVTSKVLAALEAKLGAVLR